MALKSAGFRLMNVYVVFSEHPISVHIRNLNAIKHDSILVFALDGDAPTLRQPFDGAQDKAQDTAASWSPLEAIDTNDSEAFCRQCGMTIGWLLESGHSTLEIRTIWKELMPRQSPDPNPNSLHLDHRRRGVPGNAKQPWLAQQGRIRAKTEYQVTSQTQCTSLVKPKSRGAKDCDKQRGGSYSALIGPWERNQPRQSLRTPRVGRMST